MSEHNFEKTAWSLFLVSEIFGLAPANTVGECFVTPNLEYCMKRITSVAASLFWLVAIIAAGAWYTNCQVTADSLPDQPLLIYITYLLASLCAFLDPVTMLATCLLTGNRNIWEIIELLELVDNLLSQHENTYRRKIVTRTQTMNKLLLSAVVIILGWIVVCFAAGLFGRLPAAHVVFFLHSFTSIWQVQFLYIVLAIRYRVRCVNVQLLRTVRPPADSEAELDAVVMCAGLAGAPVAVEGHLRRLQHARLALHRSASLCGQHFGPALLLNIPSNFVVIINLSYWILVRVNDVHMSLGLKSVRVLKLFLWKFAVLGRLLIICWICSSTSDSAFRSKLLMNKVSVFVQWNEVREILCVAMDKLKFSSVGFFDINMSLFLSFLGAAIAYFAILLQYSV